MLSPAFLWVGKDAKWKLKGARSGDVGLTLFSNGLHRSGGSINPDGPSDWKLAALAWVTWAAWFIGAALTLSSAVRRLAAESEFAIYEYLDFIGNFWAKSPLYVPESLHGFHYLPIMLIIGSPLSWLNIQLAGAIFGLLSVVFFSVSIFRLAQQITPTRSFAAAGGILVISLMAALIALRLLQMQMPMTAAMICATAAGMREDWRAFVLWLLLAVALKPLAIVMVLLSIATIPKTRVPLIVGVAALLLLPFAFQSWSYLANEHVNYVRQLLHITDADPGVWGNQADISTLLKTLGLELGSHTRLAIRLAAALGTLLLAWRIAMERNARATSFALLLLSTCYIALFNPRQEGMSFLVVVPGLAALSLWFLVRNPADWRGWLWVALSVMVGIKWGAHQASWVLPATMVTIWIGLLALSLNPRRWSDLLSDKPAYVAAASTEPKPAV
jgi:Glycosyltransferase family 87